MAFADQGLMISEKPDAYKAGKLSPSMRTLAHEIDVLRKEMEQTYLREASFRSEIVIEISRKLDLKINEFMVSKMKCRN